MFLKWFDTLFIICSAKNKFVWSSNWETRRNSSTTQSDKHDTKGKEDIIHWSYDVHQNGRSAEDTKYSFTDHREQEVADYDTYQHRGNSQYMYGSGRPRPKVSFGY